MLLRCLVVIGCVGCGRLGFDEQVGGRIIVTVRAGDQPIPNAIVLLDDDTLSRTDEMGRATIPAPTPRTFHVIHRIPTGSRVTSFHAVEPGLLIDVGPRAFADRSTLPYTVEFPIVGGATRYELAVTTRCMNGDSVNVQAPPFTLLLSPECLGESLTAHLLAFADQTPVAAAAVDFTVSAGGMSPVIWSAPPAITALTVRNAPAETAMMFVSAHAIDRLDVVAAGNLPASPPFAEPVVVRQAMRTPPDSIGVFALAMTPGLTSSRIVPAPTLEVDGAELLPYAAATLDPAARTVTWEVVPAADVQRVELIPATTGTEWLIYAPPDLATATFPVLPSEVIEADPGPSPDWVSAAMAIDAIGLAPNETLAIVDREWPFWNQWDARLPAGGLRIAAAQVLP